MGSSMADTPRILSRIARPFSWAFGKTEHGLKRLLFGCNNCGQCILRSTGLRCPMECTKQLRNGPCGGSQNGLCESGGGKPCQWDRIYQWANRLGMTEKLETVQPPVDWRLNNSSAWFNLVRGRIDRDGHPTGSVWNNGHPERPPDHPVSESLLEQKIRAGHFIVTAEVTPPFTPEMDKWVKRLKYFRGQVDAVNITDNLTATVRMSPLGVARLLIDNELDPIVQMTCRDKNRLALQSDVLSAYAMGVRNLFCISGDFISLGNHPQAKPVYDIDSVQFIQMAVRMREHGVFASGDPIQDSAKSGAYPLKIFVGGAANPFGDPLPMRVIRLAKKINAGTDFIQTQCVFDLDRWREWMTLIRERGLDRKVPILAGVMPVKSVKALEYMRDRVPGMIIPPALIARLDAAADKEKEGIAFCVETIHALREMGGIAGVHIMAPGWEKAVPEIIAAAGLTPEERQAPAAPPIPAAAVPVA